MDMDIPESKTPLSNNAALHNTQLTRPGEWQGNLDLVVFLR